MGSSRLAKNQNADAKLRFKLPSTGETVTLAGWRTEIRQGDSGDYIVYINPEGEALDSLQYAHDAVI